MTCSVLIICIGNIARGDDGVGHEVGRQLALASLPDTKIISAVGLDVAMAADVAEADTVVVVDGERRLDPPVIISGISAGPATSPTGHAIDAPSLLMLAEQLYDRVPSAYLVSVAAPDMGHVEVLSDAAETASVEAASAIVSLIDTLR